MLRVNLAEQMYSGRLVSNPDNSDTQGRVEKWNRVGTYTQYSILSSSSIWSPHSLVSKFLLRLYVAVANSGNRILPDHPDL